MPGWSKGVRAVASHPHCQTLSCKLSCILLYCVSPTRPSDHPRRLTAVFRYVCGSFTPDQCSIDSSKYGGVQEEPSQVVLDQQTRCPRLAVPGRDDPRHRPANSQWHEASELGSLANQFKATSCPSGMVLECVLWLCWVVTVECSCDHPLLIS